MLARALRAASDEEQVLLDVDSLRPGMSFPEKLAATLDQADAVLVVIGSRWLELLGTNSNAENDWVRHEVALSLRRSNLPVVPVRPVGVPFLAPASLPDDVRDSASRGGVS